MPRMFVGSAPDALSSIARGELLDEERIALGDRDDLLGQSRVAEPAQRELARILGGERPEREARVAREARTPVCSRVEELGPGQRHEEQRERVTCVASVSIRSSMPGVGPVHVLEDEDRRPLPRRRLDEPRTDEKSSRGRRRVPGVDAHDRAEVAGDAPGSPRAGEQRRASARAASGR